MTRAIPETSKSGSRGFVPAQQFPDFVDTDEKKQQPGALQPPGALRCISGIHNPWRGATWRCCNGWCWRVWLRLRYIQLRPSCSCVLRPLNYNAYATKAATSWVLILRVCNCNCVLRTDVPCSDVPVPVTRFALYFIFIYLYVNRLLRARLRLRDLNSERIIDLTPLMLFDLNAE